MEPYEVNMHLISHSGKKKISNTVFFTILFCELYLFYNSKSLNVLVQMDLCI